MEKKTVFVAGGLGLMDRSLLPEGSVSNSLVQGERGLKVTLGEARTHNLSIALQDIAI